MRYSFCFRPFDVKNIQFAAIYRQKCDEKLKNGTNGINFWLKKTKEKATY